MRSTNNKVERKILNKINATQEEHICQSCCKVGSSKHFSVNGEFKCSDVPTANISLTACKYSVVSFGIAWYPTCSSS